MNYNNVKISDITRALKAAKYRRVDVSECFPELNESGIYYKYNGDLYIQAENGLKFGVDALKNRNCSFGRYHITATDESGAAYEMATNCAEYFFPLLFGYLYSQMSAAEISNKVINE